MDRIFEAPAVRGGVPFGDQAPAVPRAVYLGEGFGGPFGLLGDLLQLALVGLLLYLAYRAIARGRGFRGRPLPWAGGGAAALDTARARFARGDIGTEEFQSIRRALREEDARQEERAWGPPSWTRGWGGDRALDIARERLARSEITPEQYETIRKGLQG